MVKEKDDGRESCQAMEEVTAEKSRRGGKNQRRGPCNGVFAGTAVWVPVQVLHPGFGVGTEPASRETGHRNLAFLEEVVLMLTDAEGPQTRGGRQRRRAAGAQVRRGWAQTRN